MWMKRNAKFQMLCPHCWETRTYKEMGLQGVWRSRVLGGNGLPSWRGSGGLFRKDNTSLISFLVSLLASSLKLAELPFLGSSWKKTLPLLPSTELLWRSNQIKQVKRFAAIMLMLRFHGGDWIYLWPLCPFYRRFDLCLLSALLTPSLSRVSSNLCKWPFQQTSLLVPLLFPHLLWLFPSLYLHHTDWWYIRTHQKFVASRVANSSIVLSDCIVLYFLLLFQQFPFHWFYSLIRSCWLLAIYPLPTHLLWSLESTAHFSATLSWPGITHPCMNIAICFQPTCNWVAMCFQ